MKKNVSRTEEKKWEKISAGIKKFKKSQFSHVNATREMAVVCLDQRWLSNAGVHFS